MGLRCTKAECGEPLNGEPIVFGVDFIYGDIELCIKHAKEFRDWHGKKNTYLEEK